MNWHIAFLPLSSVAIAVTVVVDTGNSAATRYFPTAMNSRVPLMYWIVGILQSSFALALGNRMCVLFTPQLTKILRDGGQVMVGGSLSTAYHQNILKLLIIVANCSSGQN